MLYKSFVFTALFIITVNNCMMDHNGLQPNVRPLGNNPLGGQEGFHQYPFGGSDIDLGSIVGGVQHSAAQNQFGLEGTLPVSPDGMPQLTSDIIGNNPTLQQIMPPQMMHLLQNPQFMEQINQIMIQHQQIIKQNDGISSPQESMGIILQMIQNNDIIQEMAEQNPALRTQLDLMFSPEWQEMQQQISIISQQLIIQNPKIMNNPKNLNQKLKKMIDNNDVIQQLISQKPELKAQLDMIGRDTTNNGNNNNNNNSWKGWVIGISISIVAIVAIIGVIMCFKRK